jgi:hypothetical protein
MKMACNKNLRPLCKKPLCNPCKTLKPFITYRFFPGSADLCPEKGTVPYDPRGHPFHEKANHLGMEERAKKGITLMKGNPITMDEEDSLSGS